MNETPDTPKPSSSESYIEKLNRDATALRETPEYRFQSKVRTIRTYLMVPVAIMSFVIARQFGISSPVITASIVFASTLLSRLLVTYLLRKFGNN